MKMGQACAIFEQMESDRYTDIEKGEAIEVVLKMATHNSITKATMLKVIKYLWDLCYEWEEEHLPLTLEGLRQMDGLPVYLQFGDGFEGWAIVLIDGNSISFVCPNFNGHCEPDEDFYNMEWDDPDGHFGLHILGWRSWGRAPERGSWR